MKLKTRFPAPLAALFVLLSITACGDPSGSQFEPLMAIDSLVLAAPLAGETQPTAFDVKVINIHIGGPRFPERAEHADQWDIAVRSTAEGLRFVPAGALGSLFRPAITAPITGQTFHGLTDAPTSGYVTDSGVPIQQGALYVVRSREGSEFGACVQYSKLEVTSVQMDPVRVRLRLATNANCYDTRLPTSP